MTPTVAQLRSAAGALASLATRVAGDAERHGAGRDDLSSQLEALEAAGSAPELDVIIDEGRRAHASTSEVVGALEAGASALRTVGDAAGDLAERLAELERERDAVSLDLSRATNDPDAGDVDALHARRRGVEDRIASVHRSWDEACRTSDEAIGSSATTVRQAASSTQLTDLAHRTGRVVSSAWAAYGVAGVGAQLLRSAVRGGAALANWRRVHGLENSLRTAGHYLDERRLPRRERREMMRRHDRPIRNELPRARQAHNRSQHALRTDERLTRVGQALQNDTNYTRFVRGAGVAGLAASGVSSVNAIREGDTEGIVTGTATMVGSGMMMFPATAPAGAVIVTGALVWENREAIGNAASNAKHWVGSTLSKLNPF